MKTPTVPTTRPPGADGTSETPLKTILAVSAAVAVVALATLWLVLATVR